MDITDITAGSLIILIFSFALFILMVLYISGYFDDEEDYIAEGDTSMDWGALMNNRERLTLEMNALEGYRDSAVNETDSSKEADESWDRMYYGNN